MRCFAALPAFIAALLASPVMTFAQPAPAMHDLATLPYLIQGFLQAETKGMPGDVSWTVGKPDARLRVASCPNPEVFLPNGSRLWGKTLVGVRCSSPTAWSVMVPVSVEVKGRYLSAAAPLGQGQVITAADVSVSSGDLTSLPAGIVTDEQQAIGKSVSMSITAGTPLRQDMLRAPLIIRQGQTVRIRAVAKGFSVSTDGRALGNAAAGQVVQARTPNGQTVSGVAQAGGVIDVSY